MGFPRQNLPPLVLRYEEIIRVSLLNMFRYHRVLSRRGGKTMARKTVLRQILASQPTKSAKPSSALRI